MSGSVDTKRQDEELPDGIPPGSKLIAETEGGSKIFEGEVLSLGGGDNFEVPEGTENPNECYKELLSRVRLLVKSSGFKKRANSFYRVEGIGVQVLNFQKSWARLSVDHPLTFTVNVRFIIADLIEGFDAAKPSFMDWHLDFRIGQLDPVYQRDKWWEIANPSDLEAAWIDLERSIEGHVIGICDEGVTDAGLAGLVARFRENTLLTLETKKWFEARGLAL